MQPEVLMNAARRIANNALMLSDPRYHATASERLRRAKIRFIATLKGDALAADVERLCRRELGDNAGADPLRHLSNAAYLRLLGAGEPRFQIFEDMPKRKLTADYATLGDFARHETSLIDAKFSPNDTPDGEVFGLDASWGRAEIDGELNYVFLSTLANHVARNLSSLSGRIINSLLPHHMEPGRRHGERRGETRRIDQKSVMDVSGLSDAELRSVARALPELQRGVNAHILAASRRIASEWEGRNDLACWIFETPRSAKLESHRERCFVYANARSLDSVRTDHFMADSSAMAQDNAILRSVFSTEARKLRRFLKSECAKLLANAPSSANDMPDEGKVRRLFPEDRAAVFAPSDLFDSLDDF